MIDEIRSGFATDAFNLVEKKLNQHKIQAARDVAFKGKNWTTLTEENCFSLIFDKKVGIPSLNLMAASKDICDTWVNTMRNVVVATKNVKAQKDHECYLKAMFQVSQKALQVTKASKCASTCSPTPCRRPTRGTRGSCTLPSLRSCWPS